MKKIVFVYTQMIIGGTTTALLALLNNLDYGKYDVTLLLFFSGGELFDHIPEKVHIRVLLPTDGDVQNFVKKKKRSLTYMLRRINAEIVARVRHNHLVVDQMMSRAYAACLPDVNETYDIAFSFIEFSAAAYVSDCVRAKKKVTWLHLDYSEAHLLKYVDNHVFNRMDHILFVSESCQKGFSKVYPKFSVKAEYIENVSDASITISKSEEIPCDIELDPNSLNVVSCSRIVFEHKGYDRAVRALGRIEKETEHSINYTWYVIGDGGDLNSMKAMVREQGIESRVVFLGSQTNPFPIIKEMDLFLLPSRREGKPMAVTEALQLGVPVLVTQYASAHDQIQNGIDGLITENNEESLYLTLKQVMTNQDIIHHMKNNIQHNDYSDLSAIMKLESMINI